jgi:hypothetical protein
MSTVSDKRKTCLLYVEKKFLNLFYYFFTGWQVQNISHPQCDRRRLVDVHAHKKKGEVQ